VKGVARVRAVVSGRVQGVGYRYFVQGRAAELGLSGYVKNLPDGDVELEAEGPRPELDRLLAYLHQGPPLSRIDNLVISDLPAQNEVAARFTVS
jgi:acylphosphatase